MKPKRVEDYRIAYDYDGYVRHERYYRDETEQEIKERNMSRRTFRLLKDTDFLKAGTIVQEACDDGDQCYQVLDFDDFVKFNDFDDYDLGAHSLSRKAVENNPDWYEEVVMSWATKVKRAVKKATKGKK